MEKNYYKQYYTLERNHWWFLARADILMSHIKKVIGDKKDIKILNIGAATGYSSELLLRFGEVTSIEYDKDCYDFLKENTPLSILNGSILDLPFEANSFDLVCAFDVIEHVEDDILATNEMRRVCKKEGIICITVPAFMFLWSQHDVINHHHRRYTASNLKKLFENHDKPVFHSYFNFWLFFPIALFRLISNAVSKIFSNNKKAQSDFDNVKMSIFNPILYRLFTSENIFLKRFISLPIGVSILSTWRKK